MLTQARLKELVTYDAERGIFFWLVKGKFKQIGDPVGQKHPKGYLQVRLDGEKYLIHRLAFLYVTGNWPHNQVDHIDRNKSNNCWNNLRDVTGSINLGNSKELWSNNSSGVKGVCWFPRYSAWQAQICVRGEQIYLGRFTNKDMAIAARKAAEERYFAY